MLPRKSVVLLLPPLSERCVEGLSNINSLTRNGCMGRVTFRANTDVPVIAEMFATPQRVPIDPPPHALNPEEAAAILTQLKQLRDQGLVPPLKSRLGGMKCGLLSITGNGNGCGSKLSEFVNIEHNVQLNSTDAAITADGVYQKCAELLLHPKEGAEAVDLLMIDFGIPWNAIRGDGQATACNGVDCDVSHKYADTVCKLFVEMKDVWVVVFSGPCARPTIPQPSPEMYRPRQSESISNGTVVEISPFELYYATCMPNQTRRDTTDKFSYESAVNRGCMLSELAEHFLKEMAFQLGFLHKFGA